MPDVPAAWALRRALSQPCARRSLFVAVVVGTVLNMINQGDVWLAGGALSYWKLGLTYLVPFCVATYGAWSMALTSAQREA
jgi:hypothetical protein